MPTIPNLRNARNRPRDETGLLAVYEGLNEELDKLQVAAQSPPKEISERNAWATKVKEDSLDLVHKFDDLAADVLDAAASGAPGAMNVYSKVNVALEACATCHKLTEVALCTWTPEQTFELCPESELASHQDKAQVIPKNDASGVSEGAEKLNVGSLSCEKGYCIVWSVRKDKYFVLYRSDKKEETFELFNMEEAKKWDWRDSAGRAHGDDGYHFGDLSRTFLKHTKSSVSEWARGKTRPGYEFGDLFLKNLCLCCCCGGSSPTAELEEIAKKLQEQRTQANELLQTNVLKLELRQKTLEREHLGGEVSKNAAVRGVHARKYKKALDEVEESIKAVPEITTAFITTTKQHGDLQKIQDSIRSILQLALECEATANIQAGNSS
mmetsp:Transcript_55888/g.105281  ORF Transcript_55888/g.105281 Transcript_55888/m.105281 type:complete len:382 (+) Transcript_55888:98-1243(+)